MGDAKLRKRRGLQAAVLLIGLLPSFVMTAPAAEQPEKGSATEAETGDTGMRSKEASSEGEEGSARIPVAGEQDDEGVTEKEEKDPDIGIGNPVCEVSYADPVCSVTEDEVTVCYFAAPAVLTLRVTEEDFCGENFELWVSRYEESSDYESWLAGRPDENIPGRRLDDWEPSADADDTHRNTCTLEEDGTYLVFAAYTDEAGNRTELYQSDVFVVDTVAPTMTAEYSEAGSRDGGTLYYGTDQNGAAEMTIRVIEANFCAEDVTVQVSKNGGEVQAVTPSWTDESRELHIGRLQLSGDGSYTVTVEYADRSGNSMEVYTSDTLVIDTQSPEGGGEQTPPRKDDISGGSSDEKTGGTGGDSSDEKTEGTGSGSSEEKNEGTGSGSSDEKTEGTGSGSSDEKTEGTGSGSSDEKTEEPGGGSSDKKAGSSDSVDTGPAEPTFTINGETRSGDGGGAYRDDVRISYQFGDENYGAQEVRLVRVRFAESEDVTEEYLQAVQTGGSGSGSFEIPAEAENDGIYILSATETDQAGHSVEAHVRFTVNLSGSVYEYSDYLISLIRDGGQYVGLQGERAITEDLMITEYNPDKIVEGSLKILITRDGETIEPVYTAAPGASEATAAGRAEWYRYVYVISRENFIEDGVYSITLVSADAAGNTSTTVPDNSVDAQGDQILDLMTFTVDTTAPELRNIINMDERIVNAQTLDVKYTLVDVGGLKRVEAYVDGRPVDTITDFGENPHSYSGVLTLTESGRAQRVRLRVTDLAGNVTDTDAEDFDPGDRYEFVGSVLVSTNPFARMRAKYSLGRWAVGCAAAAAEILFLAHQSGKKCHISYRHGGI